VAQWRGGGKRDWGWGIPRFLFLSKGIRGNGNRKPEEEKGGIMKMARWKDRKYEYG